MARAKKPSPDGRFGMFLANHIREAAEKAAAHRGIDLSSYIRMALWDQLQRDGFPPDPPAEDPEKKRSGK